MALAPTGPATAVSQQPWDQPGSMWQGTIEIDKTINDTADEGGGATRFHATATYTDLVPLNSTASGGYKASVTTSGSDSSTSACEHGGTASFSHTWTGHRVPTSDMDSYPPLQLITGEDGSTFFTPLFVDAGSHPYESTGCDGKSASGDTVLDSGILTFGLRWGDSVDAEVPLADSDPDPLRLVGSTSWSNGNYPYLPYWEVDEYRYTVNYDLRLVSDDCEAYYTEADFRRARPEGTPDAPDLLEFSLVTDWCVTQSGRVLVQDTAAEGYTLLSAWEAGLAVTFELLYDVKDEWTRPTVKIEDHGGYTTVTATSKWRECYGIPIPLLTPKRLNRLADLFKKLARNTDSQRVSDLAYRITRILRKAANNLEDGLNWAGKQIWRGLLALIARLPRALSTSLTNQLIFLSWDWADSGDWAKDYVKNSAVDVTLSQILDAEHCTSPKWKPRIVTTLFPNGTSLSDFEDLDGDYGRWDVRRV